MSDFLKLCYDLVDLIFLGIVQSHVNFGVGAAERIQFSELINYLFHVQVDGISLGLALRLSGGVSSGTVLLRVIIHFSSKFHLNYLFKLKF